VKQVWKFSLPATGTFELEMPVGARVLAVQTQNHSPFMWALVDPDAPKEQRRFRIVGTGHPAHDEPYLGTFQLQGGSFVFHLFEVPR